MTEDQLAISEDARLQIMAYLLINSEKAPMIYQVFKVLEHFVDFEHYEDAAPLSTVETAFHIILLEYSELLLQKKLAVEEVQLSDE